MDKRYFSIQDLARITGVTTSKLRYMEKRLTNLNINKIRNRRYYSIKDVEKLLSCNDFDISLEQFKMRVKDTKTNIKKSSSSSNSQNITGKTSDIIGKIDALLSKFQNILEKSYNANLYSESK